MKTSTRGQDPAAVVGTMQVGSRNEGMGNTVLMHISDHSGHTTLEFDPKVDDELRAAVEAIFAEPKGRLIYAVAGGESTQVRKIEDIPETASEVHVSPQLVGG